METFYGDGLGDVILNLYNTDGDNFWGDNAEVGVDKSQHVLALERELAELKGKVESDFQSRAQKEEQEQLNAAYGEIKNIITETDTPILSKMIEPNAYMPNGAIKFVFDKTLELYKQTGQVLDFNEVASAVEAMLNEDLNNLSPAEVITSKSIEVEDRMAPTISQRGTKSSSKPMTMEELRLEALRSL